MPNRVLGFLWHYAPAARLSGKSIPVSMPNRVLGFLWRNMAGTDSWTGIGFNA